MKRKLLFIVFLMGILIIALFLFYGRVIFQRGNPMPYIVKMFTLNDNNHYSRVFVDDDIYITRNVNNYDELINYIEKTYDVLFLEQLGSSLFFESNEKSIIVSTEVYWRYYLVWEVKNI
jgi:hypothetical protein